MCFFGEVKVLNRDFVDGGHAWVLLWLGVAFFFCGMILVNNVKTTKREVRLRGSMDLCR